MPFSLLLLLTLLCSCESAFVKEVDPGSVPKSAQKVVVHCYISPQDTVLAAVVNRSRAVIGESNSFRNGSLPGAVVTLSEAGGRSVALTYDGGQGASLYRADPRLFPIQVGKTYTLTVRLTGESITATCTVPNPVPISSIQIDSLTDPNISDGLAYYVEMSWQDPAGVVNYYRVAGDNEYGGIRTDYIQGRPVEVPIRAVAPLFFGGYSKSPYLTDQNVDGRVMTSLPGRLSSTIFNGKFIMGRPVLINAYLLSTDVNYHRYHESLDRATRSQDNPFAEPSPVFSNIENGLGCFGAYNRSLRSTTLR